MAAGAAADGGGSGGNGGNGGGGKDPAELAAALAPWAYHFRRLMMDPAKTVRSEACAAMGALAAAVGKRLAPHVRALLPHWWLATFDPYADVAAAAARSLAAAFPGQKQAGALAFCRCVRRMHACMCVFAAWAKGVRKKASLHTRPTRLPTHPRRPTPQKNARSDLRSPT